MKKLIPIYIALILTAFTACKKNSTDPGTIPEPEVPVVTTEIGLVTWSPAFPVAGEKVTITFDASKGNSGLMGFAGDVYVHTGVITDKSTTNTDWKYVKSPSFSAPDPAVKMTSLGGNKYSLTLTPALYFSPPVGEKILKMAMVFRNGDGTKSGRNVDNSDIYIPIYEAGKLAVRFTAPEFEPVFDPTPKIAVQMIGEDLTVTALASKASNLTILLNGTSFATASNATSVTGKAKATATGVQTVKVTATSSGETAEASFTFTINGTVQVAELPSGAKDGVTFINGGKSAIVSLFAPNKAYAYVIGDFNNWTTDAPYFMKKTPDGNRWWIQVDNLDASKEYAYQFLVDGKIRVADPYSEKVLDQNNDGFISAITYPSLKAYPVGKTSGIVSVMQGNQMAYPWAVPTFTRPAKNNLVIYELHLRDFVAAHSYNTLKDTLNYLDRLGINAIELMPINEFEGNNSWGYNPSFYFAPDKYYGTKNALKLLIDECHKRGIAVILDMVLNHSFGQSPMAQLYFNQAAGTPADNSPWFNVEPKHPFNVGYDFNHESAATKTFSKNVMKFWMQEYKVDGFRFDLSKGFTQKNSGTTDAGVGPWGNYDLSRIAIWKEYNDYMKSIDPNNFYVILEHFAADQEERELAGMGMMMWNNINHNAIEATMGYVSTSDLSRGVYKSHGFTGSENLITYMESHDEERMMFKTMSFGNSSGSYNTKNLATALKRHEAAAVFLLGMPGPKMIWQFGELGYDISIDQNGRTGEKPIKWDYNNVAERKALYNLYSKMIKLKINNPVFANTDFTYDLAGGVKYIQFKSAGTNVLIVGNFDVTAKLASATLPSNGTWKDQLNGQTISVSGGMYSETLQPGEYHVYSSSPLL